MLWVLTVRALANPKRGGFNRLHIYATLLTTDISIAYEPLSVDHRNPLANLQLLCEQLKLQAIKSLSKY